MRSPPRSHAGRGLLAGLLAFALWTGFAGVIAHPAFALPTAVADGGGEFGCADLDRSKRCAQICGLARPAGAMLGERPLPPPGVSAPNPHGALASVDLRGLVRAERAPARPSPPLYLRFLALLL